MTTPPIWPEWRPISEAICVGQKRMLFKLARGKIVSGYRLAGTCLVRPEFADDNYLATHFLPLPPSPKD